MVLLRLHEAVSSMQKSAKKKKICFIIIVLRERFMGVLKISCLDFGFFFEDNRRTSERRAELARAIPSEEEEDVVKLEVK